MKVKISINKSKVPWDELMDAARQDAPDLNEIALEWKMWLVDKEKGLIGGIYYFEDEEAYKKSIASKSEKALILKLIDNVYSITIDVDEELSKFNKAPI
jgi:hypothetical protein